MYNYVTLNHMQIMNIYSIFIAKLSYQRKHDCIILFFFLTQITVITFFDYILQECFQQRLQKTLKLDSTEKMAMVDEFMSRLQDNEN